MKQTVLFVLIFIVTSANSQWLTCSNQTFCSEIRSGEHRNQFRITGYDISGAPFWIFMNLTDQNGKDLTMRAHLWARGIFNIRVDDPENPRFDTFRQAHLGTGVNDGATSSIIAYDNYAEIIGEEETLTIFFDPFSIKVTKGTRTIMSINDNNKFNFNSDPDNLAISADFKFYDATTSYGIPLHAERLALQNTTQDGNEPYRLFNVEYSGYPIGTKEALHGAVPVLYAIGREEFACGVLWFNAAQTFVDIGYYDNTVESLFISEGGMMDILILTGPTLQEAVRQHTLVTNTPQMPPLWGFGYHQSRSGFQNQEDVVDVVNQFDSNDFPLDAIWLDVDHTDQYKQFTWHPQRYHSPDSMVDHVTETGRKMMVTANPDLKIDEDYLIYTMARDFQMMVSNKDGTDFKGVSFAGSSSWYDFPQNSLWGFYHAVFSEFSQINMTKMGGVWNSMNEPTVFDGPERTLPKDVQHNTANSANRVQPNSIVHNIYSLSHNSQSFFGMLDATGQRPFVMTRAHFASTQRWAGVWTGDNLASWDHLKISIPMCLTLAISGISMCGADVGGTLGIPLDELVQRWYQAGAWLPFYRAHSSRDVPRREPYVYTETVQNVIRNAIRQRYYHAPLWYTLYFEHIRYLDPIIRPLNYHYPLDTVGYHFNEEYLVGRDVLVRPVTDPGVNNVIIYFPGSTSEIWYDIVNNLAYRGSYSASVTLKTIDYIPVFYRGGSILSRKETIRSSLSLTYNDPYTVHVFLNDNRTATGTLYFDDFESVHDDWQTPSPYNYFRFDYDDGTGVFNIQRIDPNIYDGIFIIQTIIVYRTPGSKAPKYENVLIDSDVIPIDSTENKFSYEIKNINLNIKGDVKIKFI